MNNDYKSFAIDLAYKAGEIIKENFSLRGKREWKKDGTPVTDTDFAVNKLVLDAIRKNHPDHGVLAEEESAMKDNAEYVWVCDPIDGTIPFSHGTPIFAFSLALVKNGEPVIGVTYDPMFDRLYSAEKGKGSFLNEKPIRVSKAKTIEKSPVQVALLFFSTFYMSKVADVIAMKKAFPFHSLSIVYSANMVAAGDIAAAIYAGKNAHDVAAVKILVEEAGGKVTDLFGNEQRYDGQVKGALMTNGLVHEEMLKIIKENVILR